LKTLLHMIGWTVAVLALIQFIKIDIPAPPPSTPADEIKAPPHIMSMLKRSCYDCHSNTTKWPWYSNIAPISFEVRGHVKDGRNWLNFNIWNKYDHKKQQQRLKEIVKTIDYQMPIPDYLFIHKDARLSKQERQEIKKWAQSQIDEE